MGEFREPLKGHANSWSGGGLVEEFRGPLRGQIAMIWFSRYLNLQASMLWGGEEEGSKDRTRENTMLYFWSSRLV